MEKLNINDIKKVIVETFNSFEIPCYIQRSKETLFRFCFDIILKDSKYLTQVNKALKVLRVTLHNDNISLVESDYKLLNIKQIPICIEIKKIILGEVSYFNFKDFVKENDFSLLYAINENKEGICYQLKKDGNMLIVGRENAGTITLLNSLLMSLSYKSNIDQVFIIDTQKKLLKWKKEFNYKNVIVDNEYDAYDILVTIHDLIDEAEISGDGDGLNPKVLIINGFEDLLNSTIKKEVLNELSFIAQNGDQANVYTILSTTKCSSSMSAMVKFFNTRCVFKMANGSESLNILGDKSACDIVLNCVASIKKIDRNEQIFAKILDIETVSDENVFNSCLSEKKDCLVDNYSVELYEELKGLKENGFIGTLVANFVEKNGRMQYLDLFLANKNTINILSASTINENLVFVRMVVNSIKSLQNGELIFDECQRIKDLDLKDVDGDESILIDKSTYSNFNEIKYLYNILIEQNILKAGDVQKDAFFMLMYEKYYEYLKNLFTQLTNKYNIELRDDNLIIENMLNSGKGVEEVKNYIALKNFVEQDEILKNYDLCLEQLGTKVEDKYKDLKQKKYLDNLLNLNKNHRSKTLHEIDLMSGQEFEHFVADLFRKMGYEAQVTKTSGDQGVDVIAKRNDITIAIQAKCYSNVVGNHAIMEAVAGSKFYKANKCIVVTNSTFTTSAKELAKANNVELWDRQVLKEKMEETL